MKILSVKRNSNYGLSFEAENGRWIEMPFALKDDFASNADILPYNGEGVIGVYFNTDAIWEKPKNLFPIDSEEEAGLIEAMSLLS